MFDPTRPYDQMDDHSKLELVYRLHRFLEVHSGVPDGFTPDGEGPQTDCGVILSQDGRTYHTPFGSWDCSNWEPPRINATPYERTYRPPLARSGMTIVTVFSYPNGGLHVLPNRTRLRSADQMWTPEACRQEWERTTTTLAERLGQS